MHVHILGICGTFMAGLAVLSRELGFAVSGSDENVYPPMSTQLGRLGIEITKGYDPATIPQQADQVVIGNVLSRGNPAVEHILNNNIDYISGPAFLARHVLAERWVVAVAGTHGKTTTASMVAWILEYAGMNPGYLIGGLPKNFKDSARLGQAPFFVVEADEYDTAFFDKRSKFVHYRPRTLVINNIEFDHADIFKDVEAIKTQFHQLLRCLPSAGEIIAHSHDANIDDVIRRGCWTPVRYFTTDAAAPNRQDWRAAKASPDGREFDVLFQGEYVGRVAWPLAGRHNMANALGAIGAACHAGIAPAAAIEALSGFRGVSRRMEERGKVRGITIYDDFAHHPTEIAATLTALRSSVDGKRIIAVLEPRSNTMRMGIHHDTLAAALGAADIVALYQPKDLSWDLSAVAQALAPRAHVFASTPAIIDFLASAVAPDDQVVIMSNGAFGNIHERLIQALSNPS